MTRQKDRKQARPEPTAGAPATDVGVDGYAQVFFLHIPKTGGVSFQRFLRNDAGLGEVLRIPPGEDFFAALSEANNYPVAHGHASYPITQALRSPLFLITFLRSPVERTLSGFEYIESRSEHAQHQRRAERGIVTITDVVKAGLSSNIQTRLLGADYDAALLLERFVAGDLTGAEALREMRRSNRALPLADKLELAKERLARMEFVGITEAFDDSLRLFTDLIGLEAPFRSYHRNATPDEARAARASRYTDEELSLVAEANRADMDLYDFGVELFSRRYEDAFGEPPSVPSPR